MKRGKRQVAERPQQQNNNISIDSVNNNKQDPLQSFIGSTNKHNHNNNSIKNNVIDNNNNVQQSAVPTSQKNDNNQRQQQQPALSEMDEKKRKIQLLKQKYLKKSKPVEQSQPSVESQIPKSVVVDTKITKQIIQPQKQVQEEIQQKKSGTDNVIPKAIITKTVEPKQRQQYNKVQEVQQNTIYEPKKVITKRQEKQQTIVQNDGEFIKSTFLDNNNSSQNVVQQQQVKNTVPKRPEPPALRRGKTPPPPPPTRKKQPVEPKPFQTQSQNIPQKQQIVEDFKPQPVKDSNKQSVKQQTTLPQKDIEQKQSQQQKPSVQNERFQKKSFAPPSLNNNVKKVPPPPPSKILKQTITKKLNKELPTKKAQIIPSNPYQQQQDPFSTTDHYRKQTTDSKKTVQKASPTVQIDDQYNQLSPAEGLQSQTPIKQSNIPVEQLIGEWMGSPQLTLSQLYPADKQTIEFYCLKKNIKLHVQSKHPGFNILVGQLVNSFIINNTVRMTQDQKESCQEVCLSYFNSNANRFNDVFLVCLVKMGSDYLQKYGKAIQQKTSYYMSRLILLKNLFLSQQTQQFVNFCLQNSIINQSNSYKFLMFTPQHKRLIDFIGNIQFFNTCDMIALLCICKLSLQGRPNLMGLYLKLLFIMVPLFMQNGLVDRILGHIKQLQIPQNLYQVSKQLKLKMLKNYDSSIAVNNNNSNYQGNDNLSNNPQQQSGTNQKGLFGYFNINKAIDKIKISTSNVIKVTNERLPKQQEEKKDEIVYDPVKKRYVINGNIPEEDDHEPVEAVKTRKAPPPPPLGGKSRTPPPMPGKRVPRQHVQRYA